MMSVGETLRQQRLRQKVQLQDVSEELKISARMLAAIEADEYDKLPGGVFAKSFVRQYAAVLGLDGEEVGAQFEQATRSPELAHLAELRRPHVATGLPRMDDRSYSTGRSRNVLPSLVAVVVVMLICSGVYGWWQRKGQLSATRQHVSRTTEAHRAAPPPAEPVKPSRVPFQAPPAVAAIPAGNVAPGAANAAAPAPEPGIPQPLAPGTAPTGAEAVQVELTAVEPVWVSVERDGHSIFEGELKPNEIRTVAANTEVTLKLGNAGGVTILLNGKPIPAPGPKGQVRTVQLTSGGFQIVPPAAPAAAPLPRAPALLEPL